MLRRSPVTFASLAPHILVSLGLVLVLVAGLVAAVDTPIRRGTATSSHAEDAAESQRASLTAVYQPYPYPYPYPYQTNDADLGLTKVSDTETLTITSGSTGSNTVTYELVVRNEGPDDATNVLVVDALPPLVELVSVVEDEPDVDCEATSAGPNGSLECTKPGLGVDEEFTVLVQVKLDNPSVTANTNLFNVATVASDEQDPAQDSNTRFAGTLVSLIDPEPLVAQTTGYWMIGSDGGVFALSGAPYLGSLVGLRLNKPIIGIAAHPSGRGYWLVASDGGVFAFGEAPFVGSAGSLPLAQPILGMASTPSGNGYWLVAADGGIFTFGDAVFYGSTGNLALNAPIVAMAPTGTSQGYYLFASDGGVFAFGDAPYAGSLGGLRLMQPIVSGIAVGNGYYMAGSDGGVFNFGGAPFLGSAAGTSLSAPIVGIAANKGGDGYWLFAADGGVFSFGAPFLGSLGNVVVNAPVVGFAGTNPTP